MLSSLASLIPKVVYMLTMSLLGIIDVFQLLFRKLAGLDCYYVGGEAQTGDIIYDFLRGILFGDYPILSNVFFGILILGFILLFLSTFVAIIRNEYTTEKADNSKGKIIGKAFKSIIYFAIVPIVVLFGVYLANVVLVAVDKATTYNTNYGNTLDKTLLKEVEVSSQTFGGAQSVQTTYITYNIFGLVDPTTKLPYGTTTTTFSGTVFKAAAYSANRIRTTANMPTEVEQGDYIKNFGYLLKDEQVTNMNGLFTDPNGNTENIAMRIDIAFADNVVLRDSVVLDYSSDYARANNSNLFNIFGSQEGVQQQIMSKYNVNLVWYYYDLWSFNWVVGLGAGIIMVTIFINIIFGLMRRIVEMIGLFIMAPALIGLMPLDNEKAYKSWQGSFVKKALMAYGAVGGMNIIFLILPELQTISFFNNSAIDAIVNTLLMLVALLAVKDFINIVSGFAGGDDANKTGGDVGKDVGGMAAKGLLGVASTIGVAAGAGKLVGGLAGKIKDYGDAGIKAYKARGALGGATNAKYTEIAKDELKEAHKEQSKAEAQDEVYKLYRDRKIANKDRLLTRDSGIAAMKVNDPAAYQKLLEDSLRKDYASDKQHGITFTDRTGAHINIADEERRIARIRFRDKQRDVNVTNRDVYEMTEHGAYRAHRREELAKIASMGYTTKKVENRKKHEAGVDRRGSASHYAGEVVQVVKPSFPPIKNAVTANLNIFGDNNFAKEFIGKEGANIKDMVYRVGGKTLAEVEKAKTKAKEAATKASDIKAQADAIAEALKRSK